MTALLARERERLGDTDLKKAHPEIGGARRTTHRYPQNVFVSPCQSDTDKMSSSITELLKRYAGDAEVLQMLRGLDRSQLDAASAAFAGPLLITAGPGAGKTRTILARVGAMIALGTSPGRILLISFTRSACAELRERLVFALGERGSRVKVHTFHSYALGFLKASPAEAEEALLAGTPPRLRDAVQDALPAVPGGRAVLTKNFRLVTSATEFRAFFQIAMFEEVQSKVDEIRTRSREGGGVDKTQRFILPVSPATLAAMRGGELPLEVFLYDKGIGVWHWGPGGELEHVTAAPPKGGGAGGGGLSEAERARRLLKSFEAEEKKMRQAWLELRKAGYGLADVAKLSAAAERDLPAVSGYRRFLRNFVRVIARLLALIVDRGFLFMHDVVPLATALLRGDKRSQEAVGLFRAILADEFQDSAQNQFSFLNEVAKHLGQSPADPERALAVAAIRKGPALTCVGDPNQSIFGFQGAMADSFASFRAFFPGTADAALLTNFRSQANVVAFCNGFVPADSASSAMRTPGAPVTLVTCRNITREAEFVVHEIVRLVRSGTRYEDIAVLARTRRVLLQFANVFRELGLPYQRSGASFYGLQPVRRLEKAMRAVNVAPGMPEDDEAVLALLEVVVPLKRGALYAARAAVADAARIGMAADAGGGGGGGAGAGAGAGASAGALADVPGSSGAVAALKAWISHSRNATAALSSANADVVKAVARVSAASTGVQLRFQGGTKRARGGEEAAEAKFQSAQHEHAEAVAKVRTLREAAAVPTRTADSVMEFLSRLSHERRTSISRPLADTVTSLLQTFHSAFVGVTFVHKSSADPTLDRDMELEGFSLSGGTGTAAATPATTTAIVEKREPRVRRIVVGGPRGVSLPVGGVPCAITPASVSLRDMLVAEATLFGERFMNAIAAAGGNSGAGAGAGAAGAGAGAAGAGAAGAGAGAGEENSTPLDSSQDEASVSQEACFVALACSGALSYRAATIAAFSEYLKGLVAIADDPNSVSTTAAGNAAAAAAVTMRNAGKSQDSLKSAAFAVAAARHAISLGTIHSAKGREFGVVFAVRVHEGELPLIGKVESELECEPEREQQTILQALGAGNFGAGVRDDDDDDDVIELEVADAAPLATPTQIVEAAFKGEEPCKLSFEEEQRLFFVAASRAKNALYITLPLDDSDFAISGAAPECFAPSSFINQDTVNVVDTICELREHMVKVDY